jgi:hypothetical protein
LQLFTVKQNHNSLAVNRCEPTPFRSAPVVLIPVYYVSPKNGQIEEYPAQQATTTPRSLVMHTGAGQSRATAEQSDGASTNTMAGPRTRLPVRLSAVILLAPLHHAAQAFSWRGGP